MSVMGTKLFSGLGFELKNGEFTYNFYFLIFSEEQATLGTSAKELNHIKSSFCALVDLFMLSYYLLD